MSQPESHLHEVPFAALEEFEDAGPLVGILIGSESDREGIEPAVEELNERGISNELRVLSAHRDPRGVAEYASNAALRGVRVIIAGLDQDYLGKPFEPIPQLLAIAEYITKTLAICMVCGNTANHTQRLVASSERVLVGASGTYEARCRHCFDPTLGQ